MAEARPLRLRSRSGYAMRREHPKETNMRRRDFMAGGLAAIGSRAAVAQGAFPHRTLRVVVPFAPGGGVDVLTRLYAEQFKVQHGLTVIVENRAGASGTVGGQAVMQSSADGT